MRLSTVMPEQSAPAFGRRGRTLVARIHVFRGYSNKAWMAGTSPAMMKL